MQSFVEEHALIKAGKFRCPVSPFNVRALLLGNLLCINAYVLVTYRLLDCAKELSHWGLWLTTAWVAISLKCSIDPQIAEKRGWLTANHILFEIVAPINLLITSVYWSLLREVALQTYANTATRAWHSTMLHSAPLVCVGINFYVSDIIIKASHGLILFPISIIYGVLNYQTTKAQGYPVYHFLTWEDINSTYTYVAMSLGTLASFYLLAYVTQRIKRPDASI